MKERKKEIKETISDNSILISRACRKRTQCRREPVEVSVDRSHPGHSENVSADGVERWKIFL